MMGARMYPQAGSFLTSQVREQIDEGGMTASEQLGDLVVDILERIVAVEFVEDRKQQHVAGDFFLLAEFHDLQQ